jgi:hypothetical protein
MVPICTYIDYVFFLTKSWFDYILGDFFTNSSGHTDGSGQGDQTGRILAYRALGSFWKITEVGHIFWQLFPLLHSF